MHSAKTLTKAALDGMSKARPQPPPETTTAPPADNAPLPDGFETFGEPALLRAFEKTCDFIRAMEAEAAPYWLALLGPAGVGKTYLARAVWRAWCRSLRWRKANHPDTGAAYNTVRHGQFVHWPSVVEEMHKGQFGRLDDLRHDALVIIDDIGAEYDPRGLAQSKLYQLLDARVAAFHRPAKWTVLTSNMSLQQLASMDQRIASRMLRGGSVACYMDAQDYNLRK